MIQHFKKLSKHTLIYGLGDVIIKAIAFLLIPLYTHHLATSEYGEYALVYAIEIVLPMVLSLGFNFAILKVFHDYESEKDKQETIFTAIVFIFGYSLPLILFCIFNAEFIARLIGFSSPETYGHFLKFTFATVFFSIFRMLALAIVRAYERSFTFTIINIFHFTCLISLNFLNVAILDQKILGIVHSSFITSVIVFIIILISTRRYIRPVFSRDKLRRLLKFGLPLVPGSLASWGLIVADRFLLNKLAGANSVGIYEIGHKFGMIVNMLLVQPFRKAWLPFMFSVQKDKDAKRIYASTLTYVFLGACWLTLALGLLAREIVQITTPAEYMNAYQAVLLIALSYMMYGIYYTVDVGVLIKGKTGAYAIITWIGATLDITLAWFLIPHLGMMGAAVAKLIAFTSLAGMMYFTAQHYFPIR
ncbi:oligosaccharide flippase family protein, partial [bacterium]|nr:oligosaccharide flippase family protein [bacterium]